MTAYVIDWQAVATLITGALAVGGAVYVGDKQTKIAKAQTAILDRQARSAEAAHRESLFDRRFAIYQAVEGFLLDYDRCTNRLTPALMNPFLTALRESRFLFRAAVYDDLNTILAKANDWIVLRDTREGAERESVERGREEQAKQLAVMEWMRQRLNSLPELFGDELRLGSEN